MKPVRCGSKRGRVLVALAMASAALSPGNAQTEQGRGETNAIPLIVMDRVPLRDAIKNLAQQAGINIIFAPEVAFSLGDGSPPAKQPDVSVRWENLTANQALSKLLTDSKLALVEDPETTVAAISRTNQVRAAENRVLLTAGTNGVIPLLVMDEVPLADAIAMLAKQAGVKLDTERIRPRPSTTVPAVSLRWTHIKARQALVAVLDYYDLTIAPGKSAGEFGVLPRQKTP